MAETKKPTTSKAKGKGTKGTTQPGGKTWSDADIDNGSGGLTHDGCFGMPGPDGPGGPKPTEPEAGNAVNARLDRIEAQLQRIISKLEA
jgi:hypothetical protein